MRLVLRQPKLNDMAKSAQLGPSKPAQPIIPSRSELSTKTVTFSGPDPIYIFGVE